MSDGCVSNPSVDKFCTECDNNGLFSPSWLTWNSGHGCKDPYSGILLPELSLNGKIVCADMITDSAEIDRYISLKEVVAFNKQPVTNDMINDNRRGEYYYSTNKKLKLMPVQPGEYIFIYG